MTQLLITKMLNKGLEVFLMRCNEDSHVKIGILLRPQSEVISFGEDLNSVRDITNSSN